MKSFQNRSFIMCLSSHARHPVMSRRIARSVTLLHRLLMLLAVWSLAASSPASATPRSLYLLAVGVNEYDDPHIPDLRFADDDVMAPDQWALAQNGHLYQEVYTKVITNRDASRKAVVEALLTFFNGARPDDMIMVFFSGHGVVDPQTNTYHYLTQDTDLSSIAGTALEHDDIMKKLEASKAPHKRVIVLLDTCQAGALVDAIPVSGKGIFVASSPPSGGDEKIQGTKDVWFVLTAGMAGDVAVEGPQFKLPTEPADIEGHGVFTSALLRALGTQAADLDQKGIITLGEFEAYVTDFVKQTTAGSQIPVKYNKGIDIDLAWAVGTPEKCDGIDNDLDNRIDEGFPDANENGIADCLDEEICDGVDNNENGMVDEGFDLDGDGHLSMALCGSLIADDCDDTNIALHPGQKDWDNLRDDDCDGLMDEDGFDVPPNGIPDSLEHHVRSIHQNRYIAAGVGVALLTGSIVTATRLDGIREPDLSSDDPGVASDAAVSQYSRVAGISKTLMGSAVVAVGVTVGFTFQGIDFKRRYYPKLRRLG